MPYLITTYDLSDFNEYDIADPADRAIIETDAPVIRRAVATLDEARDYAWAQAGWTPDAPDTPGGIHDLRRSNDGFNVHNGGTVGPLPDGTMIEVAPIGWEALAEVVDEPVFGDDQNAAILAAYNAQVTA